MGFYTGRSGSLKMGSDTVLKIRDWSLESTVELLSTTSIDSFANTFVPGIKGATGSATVMYYRKESGDTGIDFQKVLADSGIMKQGRLSVADQIELTLNTSNQNRDDIKFKAYITSAGITVSTGEVNTVTINFTMDGDFMETLDAS